MRGQQSPTWFKWSVTLHSGNFPLWLNKLWFEGQDLKIYIWIHVLSQSLPTIRVILSSGVKKQNMNMKHEAGKNMIEETWYMTHIWTAMESTVLEYCEGTHLLWTLLCKSECKILLSLLESPYWLILDFCKFPHSFMVLQFWKMSSTHTGDPGWGAPYPFTLMHSTV